MDDLAGIRGYDVKYREAGGSWTHWLTGTTALAAQFVGTPDVQYYFEVTATDNVNNATTEEVGPITVKGVTKYYLHGGARVAMRQGDEVYYLHGDHLGSTSLTTDSDGNVVSEVRYHPYGQERWANGKAVTDFGFTSQRREGFGLYDYNARYYSPALGRFISPDTIVPEPGSSGGFNRYRYTRNNPLRYTDPSGHCGVTTSGNNTFVVQEVCLDGGGSGGWVPPITPETIAGTVAIIALAVNQADSPTILPQGDPVQLPNTTGGYGEEQPAPFSVPGTDLEGQSSVGPLNLSSPGQVQEPTQIPGFDLNPGIELPNILENRSLTPDEFKHIGRISRTDVDLFISKHPLALTEPPDGGHVLETEQLINRLQKSLATLVLAYPHLDNESRALAEGSLIEGNEKIQRVKEWFSQRDQ